MRITKTSIFGTLLMALALPLMACGGTEDPNNDASATTDDEARFGVCTPGSCRTICSVSNPSAAGCTSPCWPSRVDPSLGVCYY
ncbi:MAG: hypothetical protein H6729_01205 [Deltaproteobacteria bacterium]|nr:hypothetical protein [Deltaproteobacteria bacterium]